MKIQKIDDCSVTSPPSTAFVAFPEDGEADDSQNEFIANMVDLLTGIRGEEYLKTQPAFDEVKISRVMDRARNPRVMVGALSTTLVSPDSNDKYIEETLTRLTTLWGVPKEIILQKTYLIRFFWY